MQDARYRMKKSNLDETELHSETPFETDSVRKDVFEEFLASNRESGAKRFNFREAIIKNHFT